MVREGQLVSLAFPSDTLQLSKDALLNGWTETGGGKLQKEYRQNKYLDDRLNQNESKQNVRRQDCTSY